MEDVLDVYARRHDPAVQRGERRFGTDPAGVGPGREHDRDGDGTNAGLVEQDRGFARTDHNGQLVVVDPEILVGIGYSFGEPDSFCTSDTGGEVLGPGAPPEDLVDLRGSQRSAGIDTQVHDTHQRDQRVDRRVRSVIICSRAVIRVRSAEQLPQDSQGISD